MANTYDDETVLKTFELRKSGMSVVEICKKDWTPSRDTYYTWAREGRGTDGVPWDDVIEREEAQNLAQLRENLMRQRADKGTEFVDELLEFIENDAFLAVATKIKMGDFDASIGDVEWLAKTAAMLRQGSKDKLEFASFFSRRVFEIITTLNPPLSAQQFAQLRTKMGSLQAEVELKLNPLEHSEDMKKLGT